jgi:hypothetical protein
MRLQNKSSYSRFFTYLKIYSIKNYLNSTRHLSLCLLLLLLLLLLVVVVVVVVSLGSTGFQRKPSRNNLVGIVTKLWGIPVRFPVTAEDLSRELQVTCRSHPPSSSTVSMGDFTGRVVELGTHFHRVMRLRKTAAPPALQWYAFMLRYRGNWIFLFADIQDLSAPCFSLPAARAQLSSPRVVCPSTKHYELLCS